MVKGAGVQFSVRASEADVNRARRMVQTQLNKVLKAGVTLPKELAEFGKLAAKSAAPYDRGYLFKSIKHRTNEGGEAIVYVDENVLFENPTATHDGGNFNYARYIHEVDSKYPVNITSGDPKFMEFATDSALNLLDKKIRTIL